MVTCWCPWWGSGYAISKYGVLYNVSWRNLKQNSRSRRVTLIPPSKTHPSSLKQVIKLPCERCSLYTRKTEDILIIKDREFEAMTSLQTNLVKLTLIFFSYFFTIYSSSPNSLVLTILHKSFLGLKVIKVHALVTSSGLYCLVKAPMYM